MQKHKFKDHTAGVLHMGPLWQLLVEENESNKETFKIAGVLQLNNRKEILKGSA